MQYHILILQDRDVAGGSRRYLPFKTYDLRLQFKFSTSSMKKEAEGEIAFSSPFNYTFRVDLIIQRIQYFVYDSRLQLYKIIGYVPVVSTLVLMIGIVAL